MFQPKTGQAPGLPKYRISGYPHNTGQPQRTAPANDELQHILTACKLSYGKWRFWGASLKIFCTFSVLCYAFNVIKHFKTSR